MGRKARHILDADTKQHVTREQLWILYQILGLMKEMLIKSSVKPWKARRRDNKSEVFGLETFLNICRGFYLRDNLGIL